MVVDAMSEMGIYSIKNWSATGEIDMVPGLGRAGPGNTMIVTRKSVLRLPGGLFPGSNSLPRGLMPAYLSEGAGVRKKGGGKLP